MEAAQKPGHGERILYLDDEAPLVFLVTRTLTQLGYQPAAFTSADEALAAFRESPRSFSLVLTDLSMPGTSGLEFAEQVLTIDPTASVVIVSGCIDPADATRALASGVRRVEQKPSTLDAFGGLVRRLLP
jgi:CheY-like chemotaxis protein